MKMNDILFSARAIKVTCLIIFYICVLNNKVCGQHDTYFIDNPSSLAEYMSLENNSSSLVFRKFPNYEALQKAIKENPNKESVKKLEIINIEPLETFYLDFNGYQNLKSLSIKGFRVDSFLITTIKPLSNLTSLSLEIDNKNFKELFRILARYDSLVYLNISSEFIDTLMFPNPPVINLKFYICHGNFTSIPALDTAYHKLVYLSFTSGRKIELISAKVLESYSQLSWEANFQIDIPSEMLKYLNKAYGHPFHFSSKSESMLCECYDYTYKQRLFPLLHKRREKIKIDKKTKEIIFY